MIELFTLNLVQIMRNQFNANNEEVKVFAELENELHIESLEERLEMTTDGNGNGDDGGSFEPPKLPWD